MKETIELVTEFARIGLAVYAAAKTHPHKTVREILDEHETDRADLDRLEAAARQRYGSTPGA